MNREKKFEKCLKEAKKYCKEACFIAQIELSMENIKRGCYGNEEALTYEEKIAIADGLLNVLIEMDRIIEMAGIDC